MLPNIEILRSFKLQLQSLGMMVLQVQAYKEFLIALGAQEAVICGLYVPCMHALIGATTTSVEYQTFRKRYLVPSLAWQSMALSLWRNAGIELNTSDIKQSMIPHVFHAIWQLNPSCLQYHWGDIDNILVKQYRGRLNEKRTFVMK